MEDKKLTQQEVDEAAAYFNLASLLGRSIQAAAFQIQHPDYEPERIVWIGKPEAPAEDQEEDQEEEPAEEPGADPTAPAADPVIKSGEGSIEDQIAQIIAMHTKGLFEFLCRSSLVDMFRLASAQLNVADKDYGPDDLPQEEKKKLALAWVLTKRVFAVRHPDEAAIIISATEAPIRESKTISFRPIDDTDRQFILETCLLCQKVLREGMTLSQALESMAQEFRRAERAERVGRLAPLGSLPNGDPLNLISRILSGKNGRLIGRNNNRHEQIITMQKGNTYRITKTNKQNGSSITIEIAQADKILSKTNKTFIKTFVFILQKMTAQNFPLEVGFSLQEMVDLRMYSTTSNAWRAVQDFIKQSSNISLTGLIKKGRRTIESKGNTGILFYNAELDNGYVRISVNDKFNVDFIASYYTIFPRFAYALGINAFNLVHYIFFLARQNTKSIKDKGTFTINLDSIRDRLGLPAPEEVKNRRYRQLIIDPIEEAIEEIEETLKTVPEAAEYGFTITPIVADTSNINQWLEGYLEIGFTGDFAEYFVDLATDAEAAHERWTRAKTAALAKLAAKKEIESESEQ